MAYKQIKLLMRENFNNIWPKPKVRKKYLNKNFNFKLKKKKLNKIENYFSDQFGYHSKLFPSGRACLGVIFRYLNLDKDKYILSIVLFILYSSYNWNVLGQQLRGGGIRVVAK